jgi:DNA helicase-2/ATP-dependent DNA helicase PcrA
MELNEYREKQRLSFEESLKDMPMSNNQSKQVGDLLRVTNTIKNKQNMEPSMLISNVVQAIGYEAYIKRFEGEGDAESSRMGNIKELIRASGKFKTVKEYINHIEKLKAKRSKKKGPKNKVVLSTIHRAKGLEWENVILVGVNELILPHGRNIEDQDGLEEERRLAYVAVTRTKKRLVISKVAMASVMGGPKDLLPSRFIEEMRI